jgi:hypothetical protein
MDWKKIISSVIVAIILSIGGTLFALNSKIAKIESELHYRLDSKIVDMEKKIDKGIKGDPGPAGKQGPKGDVGPVGPRGPVGEAANLPVGTIIASLLEPKVFYHKFGESWCLADGSKISSQSKFSVLTGSNKLPDCRGMFLRGYNAGKVRGARDPNTKRSVGSYQPDATNNQIAYHLYRNTDWNSEFTDTTVSHTDESNNRENALVATETRPKNISVYFYIKIN